MKKITLLFVIVSSYNTSVAQGIGYADSMKLLLQTSPHDTNYITTLLNLADAIVYDNPDTAMNYASKALVLSKKLKSVKNIALSHNQIGIVFYVKGKNLDALDYFQQAMKEGRPLNNNKLNGRIYNNIANLYGDLKQYDKALDYYRKLIASSEQANLSHDETVALFNMGTVYTEQNNYEEALNHFEKSLALATKDSNMKMLPFILSNIGIVYNEKRDYSNAFMFFKRAIDCANAAGSETPKAQAFEGLAKVYMVKKDYSKAQKFAKQSLVIAQQLDSPQWLADAWHTLSEVYEAQHKPDKALTAYKNYVEFRDSLLNSDKRAELTRKDIQFGFEKKEALIRSENDRQLTLIKAKADQDRIIKNAMMAGTTILILAGLISFLFYKRKRDAEQKKKEAEFKAQVSDTEMKVLRLQMNPHFIFNSLNSICDYISKHDVQSADYYLTKFAKVMRLTLEYSDQKAITLSEDLQALELYLQLEAARLNNKFTYEIKVDEEIDIDNTMVPPMLLQPFVENSIWHGIAEKQGEGKISIEIKKEAEMINCIVEDNGVGRKKTNADKGKKSMGMKITKARIDILNKLKRSKAAIELFDLHEGLRVQVKLPLELNF